MDTLTATVTRIRWQGGGRAILEVMDTSRGSQIAIGVIEEPSEGQAYEFTGEWKLNHQRQENQFQFVSFRTLMPSDRPGILHYLIHSAKWVGPVIAKELCDNFGNEVLSLLKTDPDRVTTAGIRGLTPDRVRLISQSLKNNEKTEQAMVEVGNMIGPILGLSTVRAAIKAWGSNASSIISNDTFRLMDLRGTGFLKADMVFRTVLGGALTNPKRRIAGAEHVLSEAAQDGKTRVVYSEFKLRWAALVGAIDAGIVAVLEQSDRFVISQDRNWISLQRLWDAEASISTQLMTFSATGPDEFVSPLDRTDLSYSDRERLYELMSTLNTKQNEALTMSMTNKCSILVGGPGTGKTYTVARIVAAWKAIGLRVAICAPTGKAAKQLEQAILGVTDHIATTIHSLLKPEFIDDGEFDFSHNEDNPLPYDAIIVDETSMLDVMITNSLLSAIRPESRVLFVGDPDQLPSIGAGAVLRDMLAAGLPQTELTEVQRNCGTIVQACHCMKSGTRPDPCQKVDLANNLNWRHLEVGTGPNQNRTVISLIEMLLSQKLPELGFDPVWQTQIISPTNETGPLSCKPLNVIARAIANQQPVDSKLGFGIDDKVLRFTRNAEVPTSPPGTRPGSRGSDAKVRIVNGDIGVVREIAKTHIAVDFLFPDRRAYLPRNEHYLRLAYAMTCHKMQGAEVDVVILPATSSLMRMRMLSRELLYTAFSRAKRLLVTIGNLNALSGPIRKVMISHRTTNLLDFLNKGIPNGTQTNEETSQCCFEGHEADNEAARTAT